MLQFVCHSTLQNLLITSNEGTKCVKLSNNAFLISDYLPNESQPIHAGLLEATKFRLFYPSHYIYIASFFPKEKLLPYDTFGILQLSGTEFIRLPFQINQLLFLIEEKQKTEFSLSETNWETFAIRACKALLKEKLRVINHDLGNKIFHINLAIQSKNINSLKKNLKLLKSICINKEIVEMFYLSIISEKLSDDDDFFKTFAEFCMCLNNIIFMADDDIGDLSDNIDTLNNKIEILMNYES